MGHSPRVVRRLRGFFGYQVWKASKLVLVGKPENRFDNWGARVSEVLSGWLGQKKVLKDRIAGGIHVLMFWGFLMLSTDMFDLASGNQFSQKVLPEFMRGPWNLMVEVGYHRLRRLRVGAAASRGVHA